MSVLTFPLVAYLTAAVAVVASTPAVKGIGLATGRVDMPGERKIHSQPIVRIGGIAIFVGTLVAILTVFILMLDANRLPVASSFISLGLGATGFFAIGLADDFFTLSPLLRLGLQLAIASGTWWGGVQIALPSLPFVPDSWEGAASWLVTAIWLAGMANAVNWIDGLDGLAAGVTSLGATTLAIVAYTDGHTTVAAIAAALAGATLGFLRYNFNPASIFMGDGGAYFLGFTSGAIAVLTCGRTPEPTSLLLPFLILAVPIGDMVYVILARVSEGRSPFFPDSRHLHHRLLQGGATQRLTALFIYTLAAFGGSVALLCAGVPYGWQYLLGASLLLVASSGRVWYQFTKAAQKRRSSRLLENALQPSERDPSVANSK